MRLNQDPNAPAVDESKGAQGVKPSTRKDSQAVRDQFTNTGNPIDYAAVGMPPPSIPDVPTNAREANGFGWAMDNLSGNRKACRP
jgi:hypothetical protein